VSDLPAWRQGDLPHAPTYNPVNLVRVIGPGAILLGLSLGAGDWLLGPAVAAAYGPSLLWVCTLSILFQGVLNTEMARYTLATGEPVFTGFMRQRPGPRTWAVIYSLLHLAQVGWAGWALAGGSWGARLALAHALPVPLLLVITVVSSLTAAWIRRRSVALRSPMTPRAPWSPRSS
jgi:Mn2+/Fe2+ NRAMP family transporter